MDSNCPNCQQPISITDTLAGQKVSCPHCGQHIQLPPAEPTSPYATPGTASPAAPGAVAPSPRTSGLAITSLVLAIVGLVIPFICHLASIIFGHVARSQIKKDPNLAGGGLALAGLIISYIFVVILPIAILAAISLPVYNKVTERAKITKELTNMRQVMLASKMYAIDHAGKFPGSLDQLLPDYLDDPRVLHTPLKPGGGDPFIYFPGHTEKSSPDAIVLASPVVQSGRRSVATADGAALVLKELEYQQRSSGQP
jgi:Tfp pilus assembly major pilin PilA